MTEAQFIINNINMYYDGVFNRLQNENQVLHTQPLLLFTSVTVNWGSELVHNNDCGGDSELASKNTPI